MGFIGVLLVCVVISFCTVSCSGTGGSKSQAKKPPVATQKKNDYYEIRRPKKDGVNIRTGPGTDFSKDESGTINVFEKLYILEEKNGWLKFRVTPKDVGWSGWILKELTELDTSQ